MTETGNEVPGVDEPRPDNLMFTNVKARAGRGAFASEERFAMSTAQPPAPPAVMNVNDQP